MQPQEINKTILGNLQAYLDSWCPGGSVEKEEYSPVNPNRSDSKPGSFRINLKTGVWSDFATGDSGSDPIALYAYLKTNDNQGEAIKQLRSMLGGSNKTTGGFLSQKYTDKRAKAWLKIFEEASPRHESTYLKNKRIEGLFTARVVTQKHSFIDKKKNEEIIMAVPGDLLIPIYQEGIFAGVQKISLNPENHKYDKRFYVSNMQEKPAYSFLKNWKNADTIYLVEGFATGASVQMAVPNIPVVVALTAKNIPKIIPELRKINPKCKICIAADKDHVGIENSELAKKENNYVVYLTPNFTKKDIEAFKSASGGKFPNDFNDLHLIGENGLSRVRKSLFVSPASFYKIRAMGHRGDSYYYTSTCNPQIITIGAKHAKSSLTTLVPSMDYWKANYPLDFKGNVNWEEIEMDLKAKCHKKGYFHEDNVRGTGYWEEGKEIIFNDGKNIHFKGGSCPISEYESRFIYTIGAPIPVPTEEDPSEEELLNFRNLLEALAWDNPDSAKLLTGWITVAPFCGILPWRSHAWLTGPSSAGKSFVNEKIVHGMVGNHAECVQGNTTEPGLRQELGVDARPTLFDEFETDDKKSAKRIQGLIEFFRVSSSNQNFKVAKGTTGNKAVTFSCKTMAMVSSIRVGLKHEQDKSRFTILQLNPNKASKDQFKNVLNIFRKIDFSDFSQKYYSRTSRGLSAILRNAQIFYNILHADYSGHFSRQYAILLAGYVYSIKDEVISESAANDIINGTNFEDQFNSKDESEKDEVQCFNHLMDYIVRVGDKYQSVSEHLESHPYGNKELESYGIKRKNGFICIANNNPNLSKIFDDTPWATGWHYSLRRIKGADNNNNKPLWINGKPCKITRIPSYSVEVEK